MTQKELLYLEDLLSAETLAQKTCSDFSAKSQDQQLKSHFSTLATYHQQNVTKLFGLLN